MADITTALAQLPLLRGLGDEALTAIAEAGVPIQLATGDVLVRQGELDDTLYLLLTGQLCVRRGAAAGEAAPIVPGEVVGELALLASVPRSADVVAVEESSLLKFDRVHALALLGAHPTFARRVMGQIAARLAHGAPAPEVAPSAHAGRQARHEGVSVRRLKAGSETALRQTLAATPAADLETAGRGGVRSMQIFQRGRIMITIWASEGNAEEAPDPLFAQAPEAMRSLFEEADEEQGACELLYSWQAP
ncbi:MAG TPA: cyclic nucleotide-binding domain-containing protein [Chloroflexota bacterium]|nr:cyclic nucleotide-binding domain-containing protein [Chloroflexota bacterium]